jgi:hypothetical protein
LKTSLQVMLSMLNFAENITAKRESFQMSLITITVKLPANRDLYLKWQPSSLQRTPKLRASLLAQERLEMESLILANEAAVAEIRKQCES